MPWEPTIGLTEGPIRYTLESDGPPGAVFDEAEATSFTVDASLALYLVANIEQESSTVAVVGVESSRDIERPRASAHRCPANNGRHSAD